MCDAFLCVCESPAEDTTINPCESNMDLVLSKLEKDTSAVFTWFQNNYLKANSGKSHLLTTSDNVLHINVRENQLSSRKYEEHVSYTNRPFEDHLLNIVKQVNQKRHALARISKCTPQKKSRTTMKASVTSQFAY